MAEPEESFTGAARHATVFVRDLWRRHRARKGIAPTVALTAVLPRIDLLVTSVFGKHYPIRIAEPPAPPALLTFVFGRRRGPVQRRPIPATDGMSLWLPADLGLTDPALALERYRTMALEQAMRAERGGPALIAGESSPLVRDFFLLLEACAADTALQRLLPGTAASINGVRRAALATRPALYSFPGYAQPLERFVRHIIKSDCADPDPAFTPESAAASLAKAKRIANDLLPKGLPARARRTTLLFRDRWTGEFRPPTDGGEVTELDRDAAAGDPQAARPKSTRNERRSDVRPETPDAPARRPPRLPELLLIQEEPLRRNPGAVPERTSRGRGTGYGHAPSGERRGRNGFEPQHDRLPCRPGAAAGFVPEP